MKLTVLYNHYALIKCIPVTLYLQDKEKSRRKEKM